MTNEPLKPGESISSRRHIEVKVPPSEVLMFVLMRHMDNQLKVQEKVLLQYRSILIEGLAGSRVAKVTATMSGDPGQAAVHEQTIKDLTKRIHLIGGMLTTPIIQANRDLVLKYLEEKYNKPEKKGGQR